MTRFLSGPTRSVVNNILFTLDLSCRRHGDLYYLSTVRASEPEHDFISPVTPDVQHPPAAYRAYPCFHHMASFPRPPVCRGNVFPIFSIHVINYCPVFISYTVLCQKRTAGFSAFPAVPCMHYSFLGSHTAVTMLLQLGHFVTVSTSLGESVPMSIRRPPHLGHFNCSIGYSSFSGIIFHPPLAVYAEREPVNKSRFPFPLSIRGRKLSKNLNHSLPLL